MRLMIVITMMVRDDSVITVIISSAGGVEKLPPPQPGFAASALYGGKKLTPMPVVSGQAIVHRTPGGSSPAPHQLLHQLPRSVERHTVAFAPCHLKQLLKSLAPIVSSELQVRLSLFLVNKS